MWVCNVATTTRILRLNSQKHSWNQGVKGQTEHNNAIFFFFFRKWALWILLSWYTKTPNSWRHHVHLSRYHNFFTLLFVSAFSFALIIILFIYFNFQSCRGNVEKMVFIASVSLSQNKSGPHTYFEVGWSLVVFSFIQRITTCGHLLKTIKVWMWNWLLKFQLEWV